MFSECSALQGGKEIAESLLNRNPQLTLTFLGLNFILPISNLCAAPCARGLYLDLITNLLFSIPNARNAATSSTEKQPTDV
jgi:hypothetical protein